jgi:hypothetical protein
MRYNGAQKEKTMPKRRASQRVPKEMQARFEEITQLTDAFCHKYLNEEYAQLCRELTATLCRKRLSPLVQGKAPTWACGIIPALGMVNFLFDSSQTPHLPARQIWEYFALRSSTMQAKSKQIRDLLGMYPMDPAWSTPSMLDQNPLVWMLEVNGLIIDVRHAPREIQAAAFRQGLIPYIPES